MFIIKTERVKIKSYIIIMPQPGNYLIWIDIAHAVPQVGFFASMGLGAILLFLNFAGAQKMFGSYKYIISTFTLLGMMFATMEIIVYPNVHNYKAGFIFFTFAEPFGVKNLFWRKVFLASYTFFYSATVALLSVQFIYRYWAVFNVDKLRFFTGFYWLIWIVYCTIFGLQYALGACLFLGLDPVSTEYFREEMINRYETNISTLPAMSLVAYDPADGSTRWWNLGGIANICYIVNVQYGIMIYCGWSMHSRMEEKIKNFSEILKKHHNQFFKTLVLQITAPTLILFIPISFINFVPVFNLDISLPSGALLCCFTLYPAMDSLIVMSVVSEYRKTAEKIYLAFKNFANEVSGLRATSSVGATSTSRPITASRPE
ncbi:hypothetical protein B9Z55_017702 [Caenorhabditis nigoni]|uniref:Seven TM Receptor n=2 Tax=Caenorhabditis nigoni TaxID=1611254 RepID=A0A2G5TA97_9PELO|nr:hypothetical protein B9Z55_017702 [Caenorhabditis nigoni]